ncbi:MAG: chemotaxis protein CheA [Deltaproteobacteria bacterium]|nr:chemotaxis protein CheA [Deltaproteobacteria bacterium]
MAEYVDGISEKALGDFLSESQEIVESLNRDILKFDDHLKRGFKDPELINNVFRSAHSLKGLAGMFGAEKMAELSHTLETLLDGLRLGRVAASVEIVDVLFESIELFNRLIAELSAGPEVPRRDLKTLLGRIERSASRSQMVTDMSPLELIDLDPAISSVLTEYEEHRLVDNIRQRVRLFKVRACFDLMSFDEGLAGLTAELKKLGEVITTLPSAEGVEENTIRFDFIVGSEASPGEFEERLAGMSVEVELIPRKDGYGADRGEASEDLPVEPIADGISLRSVSQTVRVEIAKLDSLMNIVGELVLVRTRMNEISEQLRAEKGFTGLAIELFKTARTFERKLDELRSGIMEVRMVPLGQNFEKLSRMVRKLSRSTGKKVELRIRGADTELDKLIVEDLADPLMHILRNAFDHGIEPVDERVRAGKSPQGIIDMNAFQKGNHVVIEIADDGRGVDFEKLKARAVAMGIEDPERLGELGRRELMNFLFMPGFSTSDEVSEISGRGVGLDVVKNNIANLSGVIDIYSDPGKGTRIVITLPVTLAIIRALIVRACDQTYAIPLSSVLEIICIDADALRTIERREVIELRGSTLPLLRLENAFDLRAGQTGSREEGLYVVVAGLAENRLGIAVDGLIGQQDIVIKSLGRSLSQVPGVAGATSLASQQTILVLDVAALIEETLAREA